MEIKEVRIHWTSTKKNHCSIKVSRGETLVPQKKYFNWFVFFAGIFFHLNYDEKTFYLNENGESKFYLNYLIMAIFRENNFSFNRILPAP